MSELTLSAGLDRYRRLFARIHQQCGARLDRASLPVPIAYLRDHGLLLEVPSSRRVGVYPLSRAQRRGRSSPFPARSLVDGHFRCHACGAKGGDIIALHRLISGQGFRDAVTDLGGRFDD